MEDKGQNCPRDLIIKDWKECKEAASQFMNDKFVPTKGKGFANRPNGCFWSVNGKEEMIFNSELDPGKVDPPFDLIYGGVCHARSKVCF